MIMLFVKLTILILVIVLLANHWDAVVAFFGGMLDWILFYMDKVASGSPRQKEYEVKFRVTLTVDVPDDWISEEYDLSTSDNIIQMLEKTGIVEEILTHDDKIVKAEII